MDVEKTIADFKERFETPVVVTSFTRKNFKKELSNSRALQIADLKKKPKRLIKQLEDEGYKLEYKLREGSTNPENATIDVVVLRKVEKAEEVTE